MQRNRLRALKIANVMLYLVNFQQFWVNPILFVKDRVDISLL